MADPDRPASEDAAAVSSGEPTILDLANSLGLRYMTTMEAFSFLRERELLLRKTQDALETHLSNAGTAWEAIQERIEAVRAERPAAGPAGEIETLRAALLPFTPEGSGEWGRYLAWIVEGAANREEGIAAAKRIQNWRVAVMHALEEAAAAPSVSAPAATWQPIETAPKGSWLDGPNRIDDPAYVEPPRIWLFLTDGQRCVGYADAYYAEGGSAFDGGSYWVEEFSSERVTPTHWMPLPDPPVVAPGPQPPETQP